MPVHNAMPYLKEAVQSILAQTFPSFKFLIINDGSTDGSAAFLESLRDSRIQLIHQPNRGLGFTLNKGLEYCKTEFIARMDADDVSLPNRLAEQLTFLNDNEAIGLVGTQIAYMGSSPRRQGFSPPLPCSHEAIYSNLISGVHALCHPSIMCRTDLFRKIGGYRVVDVGEDLDMMLRMGEISRLANLQNILYLYRMHHKSVNARKLKEVQMQYAYACDCSQRRRSGLPEIAIHKFAENYKTQHFWRRAARFLDLYSLAQYRCALSEILNSQWIKGYSRIAAAAICSPQRTLQRIVRAWRKNR